MDKTNIPLVWSVTQCDTICQRRWHTNWFIATPVTKFVTLLNLLTFPPFCFTNYWSIFWLQNHFPGEKTFLLERGSWVWQIVKLRDPFLQCSRVPVLVAPCEQSCSTLWIVQYIKVWACVTFEYEPLSHLCHILQTQHMPAHFFLHQKYLSVRFLDQVFPFF